MIAGAVKIREDHAHIDLLSWPKAYAELVLAIDISPSDAFFNSELAFEDLLMSWPLFEAFKENYVKHLVMEVRSDVHFIELHVLPKN